MNMIPKEGEDGEEEAYQYDTSSGSGNLFRVELRTESNVAFNVRKALECHAQDLEYHMEQIRTSFGRDLPSSEQQQQQQHNNNNSDNDEDDDEDEYSFNEEEEYLSEDERAIYHDLEDLMNSLRSRNNNNDDVYDMGKLLSLETEDMKETATASFSETSEDPSLHLVGNIGDDDYYDLSFLQSSQHIIEVNGSSLDGKSTATINHRGKYPNHFSESTTGIVETLRSSDTQLQPHNQVSTPSVAIEESKGQKPRKGCTAEKEDYLEGRAAGSGERSTDPNEQNMIEHLEFLVQTLRNLSPEEFLKDFEDNVEESDQQQYQERRSGETKAVIIHHLIRLLQSNLQDMYNQGKGLNVVYASSLLAATVHASRNPWTYSMLPTWFRDVLQNSKIGEKPKWVLVPTVGSASADGRHFMPVCDSEEYHEEDPLLSDL